VRVEIQSPIQEDVLGDGQDVARPAKFDEGVTGLDQPRPYADNTWSAPPTTMGVPARRPLASAAAAVTSPAREPGRSTGKNAGQAI